MRLEGIVKALQRHYGKRQVECRSRRICIFISLWEVTREWLCC
jgi:hypothetical protein